jgi:hypothetical protein
VNGTLPTDADQGVHSLTDVPVFASGPCAQTFAGVYNSIDIFYHMATCLGLSRTSPGEYAPGNKPSDFPKKFNYHRYNNRHPIFAADS